MSEMMVDEACREIAAIEGIAGRVQACQPPLPCGGAFLVRHVLQRPAEVLVPEDLPDLRDPAVRQIERLARGPSIVALTEEFQDFGEERIDGETLRREPNGRARRIAEGERPESRQ